MFDLNKYLFGFRSHSYNIILLALPECRIDLEPPLSFKIHDHQGTDDHHDRPEGVPHDV